MGFSCKTLLQKKLIYSQGGIQKHDSRRMGRGMGGRFWRRMGRGMGGRGIDFA